MLSKYRGFRVERKAERLSLVGSAFQAAAGLRPGEGADWKVGGAPATVIALRRRLQ
jgi:hypothetical protein